MPETFGGWVVLVAFVAFVAWILWDSYCVWVPPGTPPTNPLITADDFADIRRANDALRAASAPPDPDDEPKYGPSGRKLRRRR